MKFSFITTCILAIFIVVVVASGCLSTDLNSIVGIMYDGEFAAALIFSLKTSLTATLFSLILGVPAGFYLSRKNGIAVKILDTIFDIPVVVPPLVVGVLLLSVFSIPAVKDFYSFIFSFWGAAIAQFFIAVPFTIKASANSFSLVSPIYEMTAMTLGKKPFRAFWDTTFKMSLPGILSGITLTWMRCIGEFGATLLIGGGIPFDTENIPVNIYINITAGDYKKGIAASLAAIIIAFICIVLLRFFYSWKFRIKK